MAGFNRVVLVGRLVRDPELRKTNSGTSVTSFTVAVDNPGKTGADKTASFIPCTCWSKTAEFVSKYFVKGSLIGIDGRLNQRSYEDKNGQKRSVVEVIGESVQFIEKKGASADAGDSQPQPDETSNAPEAAPSATPAAHEGIDGADDDLPF